VVLTDRSRIIFGTIYISTNGEQTARMKTLTAGWNTQKQSYMQPWAIEVDGILRMCGDGTIAEE
jgi:hypothetical protein